MTQHSLPTLPPQPKRPQKLITAFLAFLTTGALLLPLPFALDEGLVSQPQIRAAVFVVVVGAAILINVILFLVGRSELRWQRQARELVALLKVNEQVAQENVRLYESQRVRADQLTILNKVTGLLTETLAPDEVLDAIVSSASMLSDAHAATVHLWHNEGWVLVRHVGFPPTVTPSQTPVNERVAELPFIVVDVASADAPDWLLRGKVRAYIALPLWMNHQLIGVLGLYYHTLRDTLKDELDVLQAFALQVAQSLSNSRAYERTDKALEQRAEQLYVLSAMAQQLTIELDTHRIYDATLTYAMDATQAQRGTFLRIDGGGVAQCEIARGYVVTPSAEALLNGAMRQHINARLSYLADDLQSTRDYHPALSTTRSALAVPLFKGQEVLGVIVLENDLPHSFTQSDSHFVSQMAYQTMIAIDNHQLFRDVRQTRDRLQVILNTMEEAIILIDQTGVITLANPRVSLLGLQSEQILHHSVATLLEEGTPLAEKLGFTEEAMLQTLWHKASPTRLLSHRYELIQDNNSTSIERQIIPLQAETNDLLGVLMVFYDKTQERELANARDAFTQMTVHDLRSPLTAVTTSLKLYGELIPHDTPHRAIIDRITVASQRAIRKVLNRVDAILDIAKMESGDVQLERDFVDIHALIENVCHDLEPIANEINVTIARDYAPNLPPVDVDSDKIERVLLNLIDNALKYSPNESTVEVRVALDDSEAGWARVVIADAGAGIPDDYKVTLFNRFTQVAGRANVRRGVGLGLNFCKLVIEAHGGKVWIEDNPAEGGGSLFIFRLPIGNAPE